jgi:hypothetical protein
LEIDVVVVDGNCIAPKGGVVEGSVVEGIAVDDDSSNHCSCPSPNKLGNICWEQIH